MRDLTGALLIDLAHAFGGAEQRVLDLARLLPAAGVPAAVVCLEGSPLFAACESAGVSAYALHSAKQDPRNVAALRALTHKLPGWVLDSHNTQSHLVARGATLGSGRGAVATVHSNYRESERTIAGFSHHGAALRAVAKRGHVIAVTSLLADTLRDVVPAGRLHTVYSAVAEPVVAPEESLRVRDELGVETADHLVLAAGRLVPAKDYPTLLDALRVLREDPELTACVVVVIAGSGPLEQTLRDHAESHGLTDASSRVRVTFLGHRDDVPALMHAADSFVMTSSTEGLPYVVLEAAAAGLPITATRVGAIGDIFPDVEAATVIDREDSAGVPLDVRVAVALRRTINDREAALTRAERARTIVADHHSEKSMIDGTIDVYARSLA